MPITSRPAELGPVCLRCWRAQGQQSEREKKSGWNYAAASFMAIEDQALTACRFSSSQSRSFFDRKDCSDFNSAS